MRRKLDRDKKGKKNESIMVFGSSILANILRRLME